MLQREENDGVGMTPHESINTDDELLGEAFGDDKSDSILVPRKPGGFDSSSYVCHVIGPTNLMELVSCPCCNQCCDDRTLNEPTNLGRQLTAQAARMHGSLLRIDTEDESDDDIGEDDDVLPGVLAAGVHYSPKRIIAEGWLHKKGTGRDWFGSRAWKPRWARLALARVDGYDFDVPLLLIYWFPQSTTASTVIVLDSTVVLAVDTEDKDRWNAHRFEIRNVPKEEGKEEPVTRTFSSPKPSRDAWVYQISQTLLSYEKQKDRSRKLATFQAIASKMANPLPDRSKSPTYDEVWMGDRFAKVEVRRPVSPPTSPPSRPRNLPLYARSPQLPRPMPKRTASVASNGTSGIYQPSLVRTSSA